MNQVIETYCLLGPKILEFISESSLLEVYSKLKVSKLFIASYISESIEAEDQRLEIISCCPENRKKHRFSNIMEKLQSKLEISDSNALRSYIKACSVDLLDSNRLTIAKTIASSCSQNNAHSLILEKYSPLSKVIRNAERIEIDKNESLNYFKTESIILSGLNVNLLGQRDDLLMDCDDEKEFTSNSNFQHNTDIVDYSSKLPLNEKWDYCSAILDKTQADSMKS